MHYRHVVTYLVHDCDKRLSIAAKRTASMKPLSTCVQECTNYCQRRRCICTWQRRLLFIARLVNMYEKLTVGCNLLFLLYLMIRMWTMFKNELYLPPVIAVCITTARSSVQPPQRLHSRGYSDPHFWIGGTVPPLFTSCHKNKEVNPSV